MVDPSANGIARTRHLRAVRPRPRAAVHDPRLALGPTQPEAVVWANQLVRLIGSEIQAAVRISVISTGEAEQLLARLSLVIGQALTTR
jgi:hypothetical protein